MTVRSMRNAAAARRERGIGRRAYVRLADPAAFWPQPDAATIARHATAAREIYAARRRRHKYLPADLFGEPTWDILLDLYVAAREAGLPRRPALARVVDDLLACTRGGAHPAVALPAGLERHSNAGTVG